MKQNLKDTTINLPEGCETLLLFIDATLQLVLSYRQKGMVAMEVAVDAMKLRL